MYHDRMTNLEWLERISNSDVIATAETRTVVDTPAFKLLLDPHNDFGGVNWATPLKQDPSELEIIAMIEAFEAYQRTPRLEFIGECWTDLAALLERAGFQAEGASQDIMIVTPDTFKPFTADGVRLQFLEPSDPDQIYGTYLETQTRGFGYGSFETPTNDQISSWRDQVRSGRRAALGFLEGQAAGVGTTLGSDLAEVQGVTTLPSARRRGIAATLSSALVADVFARHENAAPNSVSRAASLSVPRNARAVWLSVEEDAARACYAKIGFRTIGSRLNYSLG